MAGNGTKFGRRIELESESREIRKGQVTMVDVSKSFNQLAILQRKSELDLHYIRHQANVKCH